MFRANHQRLLDAIESGFGKRDVLVVGDLMLDRYLQGDIRRISPEAPVPVLHQTNEIMNLGGAANVALNLARLGVRVHLLGVLGRDANGQHLQEKITQEGVCLDGILRVQGRPTTTKTRVTCGRQQLLRIDIEDAIPLPETTREQLIAVALDVLPRVSALVLSDYAKGVVGPELTGRLVPVALRQGMAVIVDPKGPAWSKYAGATLVTPNRAELADATGQAIDDSESLLAAAEALRRQSNISCLAVTMGEQGIVALDEHGRRHFPSDGEPLFLFDGFESSNGCDNVAGFAFLTGCLSACLDEPGR
jgi:D-beta-D-heptose 7-phosphate kinase / D-beta-D-heptose 1-phosphate adenosyltransferase